MARAAAPVSRGGQADIDQLLKWLAGQIYTVQAGIGDREPELQVMLNKWIEFLQSIVESPA